MNLELYDIRITTDPDYPDKVEIEMLENGVGVEGGCRRAGVGDDDVRAGRGAAAEGQRVLAGQRADELVLAVDIERAGIDRQDCPHRSAAGVEIDPQGVRGTGGELHRAASPRRRHTRRCGDAPHPARETP